MLKFLLILLIFALTACQSPTPQICQNHKKPFNMDICQIKANHTQNLQLFWQDNSRQNLTTFDKLNQFISQAYPRQRLIFAMNAGMYDPNFAPIGYTVIDKNIVMPINLRQDDGNFYLKPNGVFYWNKDGFFIDESENFAKQMTNLQIDYATQSGPMLVINGQIHPAFNADSQSFKIRNGVGVNCQNQTTNFIISREPVNFYQFASVFKDKLACQNALFLDGSIASGLYSTELGKHDNINMAVMIGFLDKNNL